MKTDIYIMFMTPFKMINKSEKYVDESEDPILPEEEDEEMTEDMIENMTEDTAEEIPVVIEGEQDAAVAEEVKEEIPVKKGKKILYAASVMSDRKSVV